MEDRVAEFERRGEILEAQRLKKRVLYDIRMIKETGFVNGIENYSIYFDGREPGQPPTTIFDYFPDDMLVIVDESHLWIWQLAAMPSADHSRKVALVEHGFRLPSAFDHRPLGFEELQEKLRWSPSPNEWSETEWVIGRGLGWGLAKKWCKTLFVSATPAQYELEHSDQVVQQIIRPTGLLDPITAIYPKSWDYNLLLSQTQQVLNKKPHLMEFMNGYISDIKHLKDVFEWSDASDV
jgi:excinuclease ABC subunit B